MNEYRSSRARKRPRKQQEEGKERVRQSVVKTGGCAPAAYDETLVRSLLRFGTHPSTGRHGRPDLAACAQARTSPGGWHHLL